MDIYDYSIFSSRKVNKLKIIEEEDIYKKIKNQLITFLY